MSADDAEHRRQAEPATGKLGGEERVEDAGAGLESMPHPVSRIWRTTWRSASVSRASVEMVTTPCDWPIASAALITRFMMSCCIWDVGLDRRQTVRQSQLELHVCVMDVWISGMISDIWSERFDWLHHEAAFAGIGQHLPDQSAARSLALRTSSRCAARVGARLSFVHGQAGVAHDAGQQIVEIVGQAAGQHAETLQLLGLAQLLFQFLPFA